MASLAVLCKLLNSDVIHTHTYIYIYVYICINTRYIYIYKYTDLRTRYYLLKKRKKKRIVELQRLLLRQKYAIRWQFHFISDPIYNAFRLIRARNE